MASNPGEILIAGFNTGLGIRRNIEETAKLVREREMNEQADQLWKEAMAANQQITDRLLTKQTELTKILDEERAGGAVDRKRIGVLNQEIGRMAEENIALMQQQAVRLMQSGNPVAMERAQTILASAVDIQSKIAAQQQHVFDRNAEEENNEANRDSAEGIAAANRQSAENVAAADRAAQERINAANNASAERRNTQDNATARANAKLGADTQVTVAGMNVDDNRDAREQQQNQFDAELKFRKSQVNTPAKQFADMLDIKRSMAGMEALGLTPAQIKQEGAKRGLDVEMVESNYAALSEDLAAEVKKTDQRIASLTKRVEDGDKNAAPMLERARAYRKQLLVYEDQKADAEIEWSQFQLDTDAAEAAGAEFGRKLDAAGDSIIKSVTSPFTWLRGATSGPSLRKPEREARKVSKGEEY